ncbi:MAG: hypothetical protein RIB65_12290 [Ilumatobacter fluminis]|uniref:hypothetical protein n=1 Tax=Ilumatobacter fluminis TaxID=467091 RepID=UPI0032EAAAA5
MASVTALVAHQGGWDEVLLVVGPVVVIIVALTLAKRRVDRLERGGSGVGGNGDGVDVSGDRPTRESGREPEGTSRRGGPQDPGSGDRR